MNAGIDIAFLNAFYINENDKTIKNTILLCDIATTEVYDINQFYT